MNTTQNTYKYYQATISNYINDSDKKSIRWVFRVTEGDEKGKVISKFSNYGTTAGMNFFKSEIKPFDTVVETDGVISNLSNMIGKNVHLTVTNKSNGSTSVLMKPFQEPKPIEESLSFLKPTEAPKASDDSTLDISAELVGQIITKFDELGALVSRLSTYQK